MYFTNTIAKYLNINTIIIFNCILCKLNYSASPMCSFERKSNIS